MRHGRVLKVLGVKRVAGRQNPGAPKCEYVIGPHTPGIHQLAGGPHPSPDWLKKAKTQRKACRSALGVFMGGAPGTQLRPHLVTTDHDELSVMMKQKILCAVKNSE